MHDMFWRQTRVNTCEKNASAFVGMWTAATGRCLQRPNTLGELLDVIIEVLEVLKERRGFGGFLPSTRIVHFVV